MTLHAKPFKKSWRRDEGILDRDVLPILGQMPVRDVTRHYIQRLLDPIRDPNGRNAPCSVLPVRRLLSKMFNFALPRDYGIEYDPVTRTDAPQPGKRTRKMRWDALDIFAPDRKSATTGFWDVKTSKNGDPINAVKTRRLTRYLRTGAKPYRQFDQFGVRPLRVPAGTTARGQPRGVTSGKAKTRSANCGVIAIHFRDGRTPLIPGR